MCGKCSEIVAGERNIQNERNKNYFMLNKKQILFWQRPEAVFWETKKQKKKGFSVQRAFPKTNCPECRTKLRHL